MYEKNTIIQSFITNLQDKDVSLVSPEKNCQPNKKIKIIYKDGLHSEFQTNLTHNDFMREWRVFCAWFQHFRGGQANYIEDWTE